MDTTGTVLEQDCSEFVELDPTGRYGRVNTYSCFLYLVFVICIDLLDSFLSSMFSVFLQYNEILGKGASKTVYGTLFSYFFVSCFQNL